MSGVPFSVTRRVHPQQGANVCFQHDLKKKYCMFKGPLTHGVMRQQLISLQEMIK